MDDSMLNTFSKEAAQSYVGLGHKIIATRQVEVRCIGEVIDEQFSSTGLDFLSIDVEGMDFQLLVSLDFSRIRPKVICVETCAHMGFKYDNFCDLVTFMHNNGYVIFADTVLNTIFVDRSAQLKN